MKQKLLVAAVLVASSFAVSAQSSFEGFYGQVGVGYSSSKPSAGTTTLTPPAGSSPSSYAMSTSVSTANSFNGAVSAGYTFLVQPKFTLGLGVDYMPVAGQSANYSVSNSNLSPSTISSTYKQNSLYNVYIAPGFVIDKDSLVYAKLGYSGTQIKFGNGGSTNYTGYLVGLGYKQIITGGLYGFGELNYTSYGNQTSSITGPWASGGTYGISNTNNAQALNARLGIGYKF